MTGGYQPNFDIDSEYREQGDDSLTLVVTLAPDHLTLLARQVAVLLAENKMITGQTININAGRYLT